MKLLFENQNEISHFSQRVNEAKDRTNAIVSKFNELPLNKISSPEQAQQMIEDLNGFIESMIPAETVKTFSMLKPSKIIELLDIDTTAIRQMIHETRNSGFTTEFLEISKPTKSGFEVDPKKLNQRLDTFRVYASSEKELQIASDYEALINAAKKLTRHMSPKRFANTLPANLWLTIKNDQIELRAGFYSELVRSTP